MILVSQNGENWLKLAMQMGCSHGMISSHTLAWHDLISHAGHLLVYMVQSANQVPKETQDHQNRFSEITKNNIPVSPPAVIDHLINQRSTSFPPSICWSVTRQLFLLASDISGNNYYASKVGMCVQGMSHTHQSACASGDVQD